MMAAANTVNTFALATAGTTRPVQERKPRISGMRVVPAGLAFSNLGLQILIMGMASPVTPVAMSM